jgi:hypothetical protein
MNTQGAKAARKAPPTTPTDLKPGAVRDLADALNTLLADMLGLYLKTKNFHWHISGPHFRDYHLLLDEQGTSFSPPPTQSPSGCARSAARPYARSAISAAFSVSGIMMRRTWLPSPCSPSLAATTSSWSLGCVRRMICATNTATLRVRVCLRIGSTRPSVAFGSCLKQLVPAVSGHRRALVLSGERS